MVYEFHVVFGIVIVESESGFCYVCMILKIFQVVSVLVIFMMFLLIFGV